MSQNEPYNVDEGQIPIQPSTWNQGKNIYLAGSNVFVQPDRLKNIPTIRDNRLAPGDSQQTWNDCRTIEGWMDMIEKLIKAAWLDPKGQCPVNFTHDAALIPHDPTALKGVIIVWNLISMVPAVTQNRMGGSYTEKKARVREVVPHRAAVSTTAPDGSLRAAAYPKTVGSEWIWGQSMDVVMQFTVYADSYKRKFEYVEKFLDLMQTYTGVFIQTGLQHLFFRGILQEALYDPPHNEEFPNQSILYDVRIERQTKVNYAIVEQILIAAGVLNPATGTSTDELIGAVSGVPESPIEPSSSSES